MPDPSASGAYERVTEWLAIYEENDGAEHLACGYHRAPLLLSDVKSLLAAAAKPDSTAPKMTSSNVASGRPE